MPKPFHKLSLDAFVDLLRHFHFTRKIDAVHMHHTWRPHQRQYRGLKTIEGMWRAHTQDNRWSDIAQHITIAPDGVIWTGRDWNKAPASASGHNGNSVSGPFMFEMIGDFDRERDRFEGQQRETTLQVIAHVQRRFNLPVESLRFHNHMSSKSCPGTSIDYQQILAEVRQRRAMLENQHRAVASVRSGDRPFGDEALAVNTILESWGQTRHDQVDPPEAELAEDSRAAEGWQAWRDVDAVVITSPTAGETSRGGSQAAAPSAETLHLLRPHVVNLTQGQFSADGLFSTTASDVDAIFAQHLEQAFAQAQASNRPFRLVLYAHGGLVSEAAGLQMAARHVSWWMQNHVYPLYFVWETGFFETIGQLLSGARTRLPDVATRDLADVTTDPLVEITARTLGGVHLWSGMQRSAELAAAEDGGARYVAEKLKAFCDAHPGAVELHAVGHSAGSIFHGHFLPTALGLHVPPLRSVHFLAPAMRLEAFHKHLAPHVGTGIHQLNIFTMARDWERADHCAHVYRKSLLYLVYHALEARRDTPILGLEESLRADAALTRLFGLAGQGRTPHEVIWSKTRATAGLSASTSISHGGFDDDAPTMNSVVRRILNVSDNAAIVDFADGQRLLSWLFGQGDGATSTPAMPLPIEVSPVPQPPAAPGGRRRALCVGINRYQTNPLSGCVADAHAWGDALVQLGFEPPTFLRDEHATQQAILEALTALITSSSAGDVVVFQYAGHGTTLPDVNGDEIGGDSAGHDEALCPYDFDRGAFIIDDDLAAIFRRIPDGVNFTCFFDCCHSGTVSRLGVGTSPQGMGAAPDQRPRFLNATEAMIEAHRRFRHSQGRTRAAGPRGPEAMREVVFSACRSTEVAWESGGHGDFTQQATRLLPAGLHDISHAEFHQRVEVAFGPTPRQHPELDCAPGGHTGRLLQPLVQRDTVPVVLPGTASVTSNGDLPRRMAAIAHGLRSIAQALEP